MIHPNLYFLMKFCDDNLRTLSQALEENWAPEELVRYNPTLNTEYLVSEPNREIEFRINTKDFMKFTQKERLFIYKIVRLLRIYTDYKNAIINYIYFDLTNHKRFFENCLEFSLLETISDKQFAYKLDTELMYHANRFYGRYFQVYSKRKINNNQPFTIVYILTKILTPRPIYLIKKEPKKKVFKRGYRDHGSLGSEISKTLKDQSSDYSITELEEKKKRMKQDLIAFYQGWME